jgi:hypothetical protein
LFKLYHVLKICRFFGAGILKSKNEWSGDEISPQKFYNKMLKLALAILALTAVSSAQESFNWAEAARTTIEGFANYGADEFGYLVGGFISGLQRNPDYPGRCIRKTNEMTADLEEVGFYLASVFYSSNAQGTGGFGLDLAKLFDVSEYLTRFFQSLKASINACKIEELFNKIYSLTTPTGITTLTGRVIAKMSKLLGLWTCFQTEIGTDPLKAG